MNSLITIGRFAFRNLVSEVEISVSWQNLVQTASVKLPRLPRLMDASKGIQTGDKVEIFLGYNGSLVKEFTGYVSELSPKSPLEIVCEDEMWKLKQTMVTMSWPSVTLKNLILWLMPDAQVLQCPDVTLTNFKFSYVSKAKVLQKLKEEYGLTIYFRDEKLFVGLAYTELGLGRVTYHFQKNIPKDELERNLFFKRKEDVRLQVKAISILKNNKRIEETLGDKDGDQTTLTFYNITSKEELRRQAFELINKQKFDGYRGSLKAFGFPFATHGMVAKFTDERHPERDGEYFIDGTKVTYGDSGYRREIFPGRKSNATLIS